MSYISAPWARDNVEKLSNNGYSFTREENIKDLEDWEKAITILSENGATYAVIKVPMHQYTREILANRGFTFHRVMSDKCMEEYISW